MSKKTYVIAKLRLYAVKECSHDGGETFVVGRTYTEAIAKFISRREIEEEDWEPASVRVVCGPDRLIA